MLKLNLALALLCAVGGATAQTTAPAAATAPAATPVSPAKKELAARVLVLMKPAVETLGLQLAQQPALQIQQRAGMALQGVAADRREVLGREIEADLRKYFDETGPLVRDRAVKLGPATIGPMLEDRFTEDELGQIIAMLESPLNRRFQQTFPEMQRALAEKLVAEMRGDIEARARALEQTVGKRLTPPAASQPPAPAPAPAATTAPSKK
jgi:uncharacterized protein